MLCHLCINRANKKTCLYKSKELAKLLKCYFYVANKSILYSLLMLIFRITLSFFSSVTSSLWYLSFSWILPIVLQTLYTNHDYRTWEYLVLGLHFFFIHQQPQQHTDDVNVKQTYMGVKQKDFFVKKIFFALSTSFFLLL